MPLGYGGFLGLSSNKYRAKLRGQTNQELQAQEINEMRRLFSCAYGVCGGIATSFFTCGGTLVVAAVSGREWRVADRKLEMIREELTSRGIPIHELEAKYVVIPLAGCLLGSAVGIGVDEVAGQMVSIGDFTTGGPDNTLDAMGLTGTETPASGLMHHPVAALHGLEQGVQGQGHEISEGIHMIEVLGNTPLNTTDEPMQSIFTHMPPAIDATRPPVKGISTVSFCDFLLVPFKRLT